MAGEQKYTVDIGVTGLNNLTKLQGSLDNIQTKMSGLKTLIASGIFAGIGHSALVMADELQDLSNATGIATGRLLELKKALSDNGGQLNSMDVGVTTFVRSIDEAAQGSLKAQNTFRDLGITMQDLRTLGEQELMVKALRGMDGLGNSSRKAAVMMDLFGKSWRTVDAEGLANSLDKSAGSMDAYAASIKRGSELNDAFAQAAGNVKLAFLEAFSPAIALLNEFNAKTSEGTAKMDLMIAGFKLAGATLVTAFSATILLPIVSQIGSLGRGIGVVAGALGSAGIAKWAGSAFRALGPLMSSLRVIALLFSAGLGIYAASQLFDDFGSIALNVLSRISESVLELGADILDFVGKPLEWAINGVSKLVGSDYKAGSAGDFLRDMSNRLKDARVKNEELAAASKKTGDIAKAAGDKISRSIDTTAFDNAKRGIEKVGDAFKEASRRADIQLQTEIELIGKSKEYADLENARIALSNRAADAVNQLQDAQANMSKELKDAGLGKYYDEQIARVQDLARAEAARLEYLIPQLNKAKAAEELRLYTLKSQYDAQDKLLAIQRDIADLGLTEIEKKYRDIVRAADDSAKAAIRAEEARRGEKLDPTEVQKYYDVARRGTEDLLKAQKKLYDESRKFSTGWNKAFDTYVENARDAASAAARIFDKFTQGIEDLFIDFAKTGKFEWKRFVADLTEEILRSQIKQALASVLQMQNPLGSGSIGDMFGGIFGGLLGGNTAARGQSATNPMYVLDVSNSGAGVGGIAKAAVGGGDIFGGIKSIAGKVSEGIGSVVSGIGSAIGGVVDSIGSVFSGGGGGGSSGGGILDTIGSFFDGWFANGGQIGAGKFGIVGESGPELVSGPATVTPMGGMTQVTYNINAVDAASFKALVASDPSFIHAVAQQGAKTIPGRR